MNRAAFGNERITVVRHGRAVVAIVPISDVHRLQAIDAEAILAAGEGTTAAPARTPGRPTRTPRP